jgi:pyridoxal phosphate enzyme (YggS family)
MDVERNIVEIKKSIPERVKLVAVTKTKPPGIIEKAYHSGHKIFGENKVQEMVQKYEKLPKDIEWHFIGHLQSNKIKYIASFVSMIHGIDSLKILKAVNKEAEKNNRVIKCLLQFHIASESTKFGLSQEEAVDIMESGVIKEMKYIQIAGVMGMASFTDDSSVVRSEFRSLKAIFDNFKKNYFYEDAAFKEISMGMSDDYVIAVEEGSTIVRIGSRIFGSR